jgi:hypothetical protein
MTIHKSKIAIVDGDDWKGLYIDGKLVTENHQLSIYDILDAIGVKYKYVPVDEDWLYERGRLPDKLSEVKEYKE